MLENNLNYTTDEITKTLCRLAEGYNGEPDEQSVKETEYALFQLKSMAKNPYNNECWRTFRKVLQNIAKYDWERKIKCGF